MRKITVLFALIFALIIVDAFMIFKNIVNAVPKIVVEPNPNGSGIIVRVNHFFGRKVEFFLWIKINEERESGGWMQIQDNSVFMVSSKDSPKFAAQYIGSRLAVTAEINGKECSPRGSYDYLNIGNPNGREVVYLYAYDMACRDFAITYEHYKESFIWSPSRIESVIKSRFFCRDPADIVKILADSAYCYQSDLIQKQKSPDLVPQENINLKDHNIHILCPRSKHAFWECLYNLKNKKKISAFFLGAHGNYYSIAIPSRGEDLTIGDLVKFKHDSPDSLKVITDKFSDSCVMYSNSCNILKSCRGNQRDFANTLANVFKLPLYASSSEVVSNIKCPHVVVGRFQLINNRANNFSINSLGKH